MTEHKFFRKINQVHDLCTKILFAYTLHGTSYRDIGSSNIQRIWDISFLQKATEQSCFLARNLSAKSMNRLLDMPVSWMCPAQCASINSFWGILTFSFLFIRETESSGGFFGSEHNCVKVRIVQRKYIHARQTKSNSCSFVYTMGLVNIQWGGISIRNELLFCNRSYSFFTWRKVQSPCRLTAFQFSVPQGKYL